MKHLVLLWSLLEIGICFAHAQRLKPGTTRAPAIRLHSALEASIPTITFLTVSTGALVQSDGLDRGTLNLGILSNAPRSDKDGVEIEPQKSTFVVATRIGLRIDVASSSHTGTATVSVCLLSPDPLRMVWVDSVLLSTTPAIISRRAPYGVVVEHIFKIAVPVSVPAGQLSDLIGVVVTRN